MLLRLHERSLAHGLLEKNLLAFVYRKQRGAADDFRIVLIGYLPVWLVRFVLSLSIYILIAIYRYISL